jgi:hypothetical protein
MQKVKEWLVIVMSAAFLLAIVVCVAWLLIVEIVMTPIQWWNGDCTVEYSKQWEAMPFHSLLEPRCKLTDSEELDDEIFKRRQEIEGLQREIQKLEERKSRKKD